MRIESNTFKKYEEKGIEIGLEKGKVEAVKSLLKSGISLEIIAASIRLSISALEKLA